MDPYGNRMATTEHCELKNSGSSLYKSHRRAGHLDQYPSIDSWLGLAQDPPTWTRFCIQKGKGKILMTQKLMIKKEILQDLDGDDLTPPPYWVVTCLPPSAPSGLEAALMPDPGPGEIPAAAAALPPALPEFVELSFQQAPIPAI